MEIELDKIRQKKIKQFLAKFGLKSSNEMAGMKPLCYNSAFSSTYKRHFQSFLIEKDPDTVWDIYSTIHPKNAWKGKMVSFGLQYSRRTQSIHYLNDPYEGIEAGQIIIIHLKLLWGLLNIAVAHEVAKVDDNQKVIKLCYMKGGASEGSQWISLHATEEGFTEVRHLTLYKSDSNFRDTRLYPFLHTKAITEFHERVKREALLKKNPTLIPADLTEILLNK